KNNGHNDGFEHKNRGARGRAGFILSRRRERSAKCSTQMENYFRAKDIVDDAVKVNTALMFLIDIALLWWREKTTYKRQSDIGTWQEFQCELKEQFYPEFIKEEARAKLQGITQRGIVGEYVQEFKELMLQVSDVTDKRLAFQNGLKSWVRHEVEQ
ncbi:hypothetical protein Goshw_016442, partial [Gossypium schwendimanii]|nr:hypothetical protein [Gossypium schwendimanii]